MRRWRLRIWRSPWSLFWKREPRAAHRWMAWITAGALASCGSPSPLEAADVCRFVEADPSRYAAAAEVERRRGAPMELVFAIIWRESKFRADARPRERIFGVIPGAVRSSAYGYAQVIDGTWDWYRQATGYTGARRDDFAAAADFVGWYINETERQVGVGPEDPAIQYLAYHQGHAGYLRQGWRNKPRLIAAAHTVTQLTGAFQTQLQSCAEEVAAASGVWPPPGRLRPAPPRPRLRPVQR